MKNNPQYDRRTLLVLLAVVFLSGFPLMGKAQEPIVGTIALLANQVEIDRLAPGATSGKSEFWIDESASLSVEIISTVETLITRIKGPGNQVLDANTMDSVGGKFITFVGSQQFDSPLLLPSLTPGFHYLYQFPSLGVGQYSVEFEADPNLSQEEAVITQVITDSSTMATLITKPQLNLGDTAVLTVPFFDGQHPILGADVKVTVMTEGRPPVELTLLDNGDSADNLAGDGLYSAEFIPQTPGDYLVSASIQGQNWRGIPCFRKAGAHFTVFEPTSRLTGTVHDESVDSNGDGQPDQVIVRVATKTVKAGEYRAFVHFKTATGQQLFRSNAATLTTGLGEIAVAFEIEALRELGEEGPYQITQLWLIYYGEDGAIESDNLTQVGTTQAYHLDQFEKPLFSLTGVTTSQGIDADGNGLFEQLRVAIEIEVAQSGFYTWTVNLTDSNEEMITFATSEDYFVAGINQMVVNFDAAALEQFGADGPYLLRDLVLQGPAIFQIVERAGETSAFPVTQFFSTYSVSGYLVDDAGIPLAGVLVEVNGQTALTNEKGYYQIKGLAAGNYTVTARKEGYVFESVSITLNQNQPAATVAVTGSFKPSSPALLIGTQSCDNNSVVVSHNRVVLLTDEGQLIRSFDPGFTGKGIHLRAADVDQDKLTDIVVSDLAKGNNIAIFTAKGTPLASFQVRGNNQGIKLAIGDLAGNNRPQLVTTSQAKDDRVSIYQTNGTWLQNLTVLDNQKEFNLATGNLLGKNRDDIILTLATPTPSNNVLVFDGGGTLLTSLTAWLTETKGSKVPGLVVTTGDVNGDGVDEIIVGPAEKAKEDTIAIYTAAGTLFSTFRASLPDEEKAAGCTSYYNRGIVLAAGDLDHDGKAEIIVSRKGGREVRLFTAGGVLIRSFQGANRDYAISDLAFGENVERHSP